MAKKKAPRVSTKDRHRSALLHAVAKQAGTYANRAHLPPGAYAIDARISGKVDGQKVEPETVKGTLTVEHDGERSSFLAAEPIRVLAYLLDNIAPTKAADIVRELPKNWQKELAKVSEARIAEAEQLLKQLRFESGKKAINGAVKFLKAG